MNDFGAYQNDMGHFSRKNDRDLERVLSGQAPAESDELEPLATFVAKAKGALAVSPSDELAARHLSAMAEASREIDTAELAPTSLEVPRRAKLRRKPLFGLFASLTAKIAAGAVALFATTGGLAAAGELPDPLQRIAADVARAVGLEIDDPDEPRNDDIVVPADEDDDDEVDDVDEDQTGKVKDDDDDIADDGDDGDDDGNEGRDDEHGRGGGNDDQGKGNDDQGDNDDGGPGNDDDDDVDDDSGPGNDDDDDVDDADTSGPGSGDEDDLDDDDDSGSSD